MSNINQESRDIINSESGQHDPSKSYHARYNEPRTLDYSGFKIPDTPIIHLPENFDDPEVKEQFKKDREAFDREQERRQKIDMNEFGMGLGMKDFGGMGGNQRPQMTFMQKKLAKLVIDWRKGDDPEVVAARTVRNPRNKRDNKQEMLLKILKEVNTDY